MNRRQFLQTTSLAVTAASFYPLHPAQAAENSVGANWPIGCMNRPWVNPKLKWTDDTALDGIKAAGYKWVGLLRRSPKEPLIGADATPEYLAALKQKIATRGLKANMGAVRDKPALPLDLQIKDMRQQIDNGKTVGVEFLLTFGAGKPEHEDNYCKLMQDAAAYSQERGMKLVMKPHGADAREILNCLARVNHKNFSIWFDAANIYYYTGKDPLEQLKPLVGRVTGFCGKDCDQPRGKVDIDFGQGKVDFRAVFSEMKKAGFNGPVDVECCAPGDTPEAVTASARRNREFLEKLFATL
jgi:sugar phosphate isomerase/epimerase